MKSSSVDMVKSLKLKLMEFPRLVDLLQNKDSSLIAALDSWLKEIETIFAKHNVSAVSAIAGFRSKLLAPAFDNRYSGSLRRKQLAVAADMFFEIQERISLILNPYEARVEEATQILQQLLGVLYHSGVITYDGKHFQNFISGIWNILASHEQLKPSISKALSLVSHADALMILAEEIDLTNFA